MKIFLTSMDSIDFIESNVKRRLNNQFFNTDRLTVIIATDDPSPLSASVRSAWVIPTIGPAFSHKPFPVENFLARYDPEGEFIWMYLDEIYYVSTNLGTTVREVFDFVLYYEIGKWLCQTYKLGDLIHEATAFTESGEVYQNFVAGLISYHCMLNIEKDDFKDFAANHLTDDYKLFLNFIKDENVETIALRKIFQLMKRVRKTSGAISLEFISDCLDSSITERIEQNPSLIHKLRPIMTKKQLDKFPHLIAGDNFGFFDPS